MQQDMCGGLACAGADKHTGPRYLHIQAARGRQPDAGASSVLTASLSCALQAPAPEPVAAPKPLVMDASGKPVEQAAAAAAAPAASRFAYDTLTQVRASAGCLPCTCAALASLPVPTRPT